MKKTIVRIALVGVVQLVLFELLCQVSVHWRESSEELGLLFLYFLSLVGLVWGVLPAFTQMRDRTARTLCRVVLVLPLLVGLYEVNYFYYWHVRPNLGLYREPDWVAQHPQFQRELRARIEANKWGSPNEPEGGDP
ncbi:MAG: hypothetical protein JSU70_02060 [Phycisphaerales bacterium]|nr:MAG: hypothetical protein JSU70_02060 [Phycisphaerales bacterium]